MARQLRIEYPGAFYHVFSRGNQKQLIYFSGEDRGFFLNSLRRSCVKFSAVVHVYCLMPNHFHLFLETPLGNLSRMMHCLITGYTVYLNKKHDRRGHLFQGRYKSILVEAAGYAKRLSRYIHLNPVRSELVDMPEDYRWSSYGYYRGKAEPERWLETSLVLSLFGEDPAASRKAYAEYVLKGLGEDDDRDIMESIRYGILGSEEFISRIRKQYLGEDSVKHDREKPQLRKLAIRPDLALILRTSENVLGPRNKLLVPIAIYISKDRSAYKLREIGAFHSLSISGVANASKRARAAILENPALDRAVKEIEQAIARNERD